MIKEIFGFSLCVVGFLWCLCLLINRIKEFMKIRSDDIDIIATVIHLIPLMEGQVQPIIQYNIDEVVKEYKYHSSCSLEKYAIGDKIALKLSQKSGLVYDKEDLKKELLFLLVIEFLMLCGVLFFTCDILLEV